MRSNQLFLTTPVPWDPLCAILKHISVWPRSFQVLTAAPLYQLIKWDRWGIEDQDKGDRVSPTMLSKVMHKHSRIANLCNIM